MQKIFGLLLIVIGIFMLNIIGFAFVFFLSGFASISSQETSDIIGFAGFGCILLLSLIISIMIFVKGFSFLIIFNYEKIIKNLLLLAYFFLGGAIISILCKFLFSIFEK